MTSHQTVLLVGAGKEAPTSVWNLNQSFYLTVTLKQEISNPDALLVLFCFVFHTLAPYEPLAQALR